MAVEIVGRRKNTRAYARSRHRHLLRNRKETKEKVTTGLSMGQFKVGNSHQTIILISTDNCFEKKKEIKF